MEVLSKTQKIIYSLATIGVIILFAVIINIPQNKASAIGLCSNAVAPTVKVDINGQSFSSDATISVPSGTVLPFTVWTYSDPSSPNSISYPGGSNTYPGPCGLLGCPGRSYTTAPITSQGSVDVWVQQNCSGSGAPELTMTITINVNATTCAIKSFSCDGNATLTWATANCSSVSISNGIGSVSNGNYNTTGVVGTTYTITADGKTAQANPCPVPTFSASFNGNETLAPGEQKTVDFNFGNSGQAGSIVHYTDCKIPADGLTGGVQSTDPNCSPSQDLVAP